MCDFPVAELHGSQPCPNDLTPYLEASYECLPGNRYNLMELMTEIPNCASFSFDNSYANGVKICFCTLFLDFRIQTEKVI